MSEFTIKIKTLTPIWTGGIDGKCGRLYETGIIGSLRWWYEAVVRRWGYACDPTSDNKDNRCELSGKEKTDEERMRNMCPACYLFGCGGWKRQFRLKIEDAPTTPLHFRTSDTTNESWIKQIFGGESQDIDNLKVFYGNMTLKFITTGGDADYVHSQLITLFNFISKYGGLGAKLQHGFGQIRVLEPESSSDDTVIKNGLKELSNKIQTNEFSERKEVNTPYNLKNFVSLDYDLKRDSLEKFMREDSHIGNKANIQEDKYIPCAFDIRYKGKGNFGMRNWLENKKNWEHKNVNILMGVSQKKRENLTDKDRTASRLYFGMPYKLGNDNYRLRIFGFAPPDILTPYHLEHLCEKYMNYAFPENYTNLVHATLGNKIIEDAGGAQ